MNAPDARASELVSMRVGSQEFAVDIMSVHGIRGWTQPTPLAQAPHYVSGMIDLRGSVIPIVDLRARLGLPVAEPGPSSVIVVVQVRDRMAGLVVDMVSDLLTIPRDKLQPIPEVGIDAADAFIAGVAAVEGRLLSVISLESLIPEKGLPPA